MAVEKKKRASGPSGQHRRERRFIGLEADEWALVDIVTTDEESWTKWASKAIVAEAKRRQKRLKKK